MLAHALTFARLLAVLPLAYGMGSSGEGAAIVAGVALAVAIATDLMDGKVARGRGTASAFGRAFDHTTDCVFVAVGLAAAAARGAAPWALPALIAAAFAQYTVDSWHAQRVGLAATPGLRMSRLGRWNGILYFGPLVADVVARLAAARSVPGLPELLTAIVPWIGWVLVVSTLCSMADRAVATYRLAARAPLQAISGERTGPP